MATVPNTTLRMLSNVPLTSTLADTITFPNATTQSRYFYDKTLQVFPDMTYQRYTRPGSSGAFLRIQALADTLYNSNYMMFQNTSYGNKWFYAFVKSVTYVNEVTTEVEYEIDVMQTWKFDYEVKTCFVEREHANNDSIGVNIVEENLELGEFVLTNGTRVADLTPANCCYVVAATFNKFISDSGGNIYGGLYSGLEMNIFISVDELTEFLVKVNTAGKTDGIVAIFPYPYGLLPDGGSSHVESLRVTRDKAFNDIDGYKPKNNKLFTYPYNFLYVATPSGNSASFRFEFFETSPLQLLVYGSLGCNPVFCMVPVSYKFTADVETANYNETLTLSGFPQCAYVNDVYKVYLAQNTNQLTFGVASNVIKGLGAAAASLNPIKLLTTASDAIMDVGSIVARLKDMDVVPQQAKGNTLSTTQYSAGFVNFLMYDQHITRDYARRIDGYFTMFGYKTALVKVPNVTGRKSFNYVKTMNAHIEGNIPANDLARIRAVFDSGVTFWHTNDVGNYDLDNSPV